jgi:hypothetical protein
MTTPASPYVPVLLTALVVLQQTAWSGRLPNVQPGQPFWCKQQDVQPLLSAAYAREWVEGDPPAPLPEPPWTANGQAGVAAGTSNASH